MECQQVEIVIKTEPVDSTEDGDENVTAGAPPTDSPGVGSEDADSDLHPLHFVSTVFETPDVNNRSHAVRWSQRPAPSAGGARDVADAADLAKPELVLVKAEPLDVPEPVVKKEPPDEYFATSMQIKIERYDYEEQPETAAPDTGGDPPAVIFKEQKPSVASAIVDGSLLELYIDHRKNTKKKLCEGKIKPAVDPKSKPLNKDTRPFVCLECGHHFVRKADLNLHGRTHTGYRPFECGLCGLKFTQKGNLKRHARTHTGDKPYECDACGMRFAQKSLLKMHFRTHTGDRPFQCKQCGQKFTTKSLVVAHFRTHTGERPFACTVCGKTFAQKHTLQCHTRVHTGDKPYACELCNKTFRFKNVYRLHKMSHSAERSHRCPTCGKCFKLVETLRKHQKTHTGAKPYYCDCGKQFTQKYSLRYHVTSRLCSLNKKKKGKPSKGTVEQLYAAHADEIIV